MEKLVIQKKTVDRLTLLIAYGQYCKSETDYLTFIIIFPHFPLCVTLLVCILVDQSLH